MWWTTTTATTSDDAESQGLKCKIGLSQTASTDAVEPCTESNEPAPACFDDNAWAVNTFADDCATVVGAVTCNDSKSGAELKAHCTCSCPSELAPAEPEPVSTEVPEIDDLATTLSVDTVQRSMRR